MARIKFDIDKAIAAAHGQHGGYIGASRLTKAERVERARKAGRASGGWPKGKKRGPSPLRGRKVTR